MKQKLLHFFSVFMAMVIAIPIANAAASDYKINAPTKNWTTTFTTPNDNSRQLAISPNGVPYTLSETDKWYYNGTGYVGTYRITSSGPVLVNMGWWTAGAANAFDDAGNYISHTAGSSGPDQSVTLNPATKYSVRTYQENLSANTGVFPVGITIDMSTINTGGITLYCDATGDVYNANNGLLWFAQTGTNTKITAISVGVSGTNLKATGKKEFDTGIKSGGGNDNYLHFYETSNASAMKCILQVRGVGIYDVTLNYTAGTVTSVNEIPCTANDEFNSLGAHIFMMRGRKLLCRNTRRVGVDGAAKNRYSEFEILDITDSYTNPTKIATIDHLPNKYSNGPSAGNGHQTGSFIQTHKHSEDKVEIFAYVQGSGCSSYIITASPISDPVTNLKAEITGANKNEVKVSWNAPSKGNVTKYGIRYSINGGAYSVEEELTNTYKVYEKQANATYSYAVRAYYGNTNTWSEIVTSNSVTVVNYSNPVTNLQVQTGIASPYSAVVNWNAPTEGSPDKYAVSYSNDGGSTWSTAVETTTLSQVFSNLAPGQYQFKVTPYYINAWGEETIASAMVYGITNPVTNVTVAYDGNLGNSIVVTWIAPDAEVAPDKYQVCYSTDNGTSWSSVVETNDLTYTFSDLAVGTYIFKVTPIYNGFLGEETTSESISVAEATGIKFTTSKLWEVKGALTNADGKPVTPSVAVSNGMMYVAAPSTYGTISYVSQELGAEPTSWPNFPSGYDANKFGYGMDNDEAGNVVVTAGFSWIGGAATKLTIYKKGDLSGTKKELTLSGDYLPNGRADFITAQGDLFSDEGGYVWIAPNATQEIKRIKIVNGELAGVDTWPHTFATTGNSNQIIVRPLADGRLYVQHRGNVYKIIDMPSPGTEITTSMIKQVKTTDVVASYGMVSSDMFILQGHTFHVRNDGAKNQSIGITIKNLTEEGNGDETYTPFEGKATKEEYNGVTGLNGYGSFVRAVKVDDYNYDVYSYSMNHGVTVYRVSAAETYIRTDNLTSLTYNYVASYDESGNKVQDVELVWEAPDDATPSNYKIYRNGSLYKTVDGSTLTYTDKAVSQNYTYKVVPIFTGANEDGSLGLEVTTTEVETVLYAPTITEVRNYDGYSIVELFYQMPTYNKVKPVSYNVYRDGVLLASGLTQYNFIDDDLPKVENDITYEYVVEAVYDAKYDNTTRTSKKETVTVKFRDWSLSGYQLQEVYNIPIDSKIGNLPNNFENLNYYRQGHFYNGSWYIAQSADNLSKKDDPTYTNTSDKYTEIESAVDGTTGGVVAIKATNESDIFNGFTGKPITSDAFASVGLAIDDAGNIFMRHNNDSNADMATTAPAIDPVTGQPVSWPTYISDGYSRRITRGAIYKHKGDGTYETTPNVINLNTLWTSNDWINTMVCSYKNSDGTAGDKNGQVTGRSDYYNMYGDVMSAEGGFLILSPSWTRTIFKVKIANGQYVNHETHELDEYQSKEGMVEIKTGTENYGFKIDGRNAWMAQIRSNGYFGIHGEEDNHEGEHEHEMHAIFVTDSRVNNAGGTSIVAFDNPDTEGNDGEIFLITPACMHSRNQGDFIVTRGLKEKANDLASDAKLMPPMPVAQVKQTEINSNVATNASGNWFHAEVGTYVSTDGKESECVYIYQYVPGVRFAKYRMVSDLTLPVVTPSLAITTSYNENRTDIINFKGVATWERPNNVGGNNAENASVWIDSYTVELLDAKGNVVATANVPETKDDEGKPVVSYAFDYEEATGKVGNECDLSEQTYTVRVAVNYAFANGDMQQSEFNLAMASNTYVAKAANNPSAYTYKNTNAEIEQWVEKENGEWVVEKKPVDSYRIELNFDAADGSEPVSYYTIKAIRNKVVNGEKVTDEFEITDFDLHMGETIENGVIRANNVKTSQIPGDYDFGANRAPFYKVGDNYTIHTGGQSRQKSVLTWHHTVAPGTYSNTATTADGDTEVIMEPDNWEYYVVAHYAANNRAIAKEAVAVVEKPAPGFIVTGVEVIGEDEASSLKIYPIPASTEITIKSHEAINSIVIYNEVGVEMMSLVGDGETTTVVNIEDLPTGYYFVRVNSQPPVKIIKK